MIQAAFFDIDGTIYFNRENRVLDSTNYALDQLKSKGVKLFLCTNRSIEEIHTLPKELTDKMDGYVSLAGSELSVNKERILVPELDREQVRAAIQYLDEYHVIYRWVEKGKDGHLGSNHEELIEIFDDAYGDHPSVQKYAGEPVSAILYFSNDEKIKKDVAEILSSAQYVDLGYSNEIIAKGADKGTGLRKMCEYFQIDVSKSAAFGDGGNDVMMLKTAGFGIAMGNAKPQCKEIADYVTDQIENDGLYQACLHYGWIEKENHEN